MRAFFLLLAAVIVATYGLGWHPSLWLALSVLCVAALLSRPARTRTVRPLTDPSPLPPLGGFGSLRASSSPSREEPTTVVTRINAAIGSSTGIMDAPRGAPGDQSAGSAILQTRAAPSRPTAPTGSGSPEDGNPGQPLERAALGRTCVHGGWAVCCPICRVSGGFFDHPWPPS